MKAKKRTLDIIKAKKGRFRHMGLSCVGFGAVDIVAMEGSVRGMEGPLRGWTALLIVKNTFICSGSPYIHES